MDTLLNNGSNDMCMSLFVFDPMCLFGYYNLRSNCNLYTSSTYCHWIFHSSAGGDTHICIKWMSDSYTSFADLKRLL